MRPDDTLREQINLIFAKREREDLTRGQAIRAILDLPDIKAALFPEGEVGQIGPRVGRHSPINIWFDNKQIAMAVTPEWAAKIVAALVGPSAPAPFVDELNRCALWQSRMYRC